MPGEEVLDRFVPDESDHVVDVDVVLDTDRNVVTDPASVGVEHCHQSLSSTVTQSPGL